MKKLYLVPIVLLFSFVLCSSNVSIHAQGDSHQELSEKVKKAINKGVEFLKNKQKADGSWDLNQVSIGDRTFPAGETALVLHTLLESGVEPKDSQIQKGFKFLFDQDFKDVYTVALSIMAVESLFIPEEERKQAEDFVGGTSDSVKIRPRNLSPKARKFMLNATKWLLKNLQKDGGFSYGMENPPGDIDVNKGVGTGKEGTEYMLTRSGDFCTKPRGYDNSNTQYALLGFHSAARCNIKIHPKHWKRMLKHWLDTQEEDGPEVDMEGIGNYGEEGENATKTGEDHTLRARGWTYGNPEGASGDQLPSGYFNMTTGGIGSVQIALSNLKIIMGDRLSSKIKEKATQSIHDGIAWIYDNYGRYPKNVQTPIGAESVTGGHPYYGMYALERAMMLTRTKTFGGHEWYWDGAEFLVEDQANNGSWAMGGKNKTIASCFALLFLKRATLPVTTK